MRFSGRRFWSLVGVVGLLVGFGLPTGAAAGTNANNKVIIYPTSGESIGQLKQEGVTHVQDYGSYWLVEATDDQVKVLKQRHGDHAVEANYLNRIELRTQTVDTTTAQPASANHRQAARSGTYLRLIQFNGPIQPEWLDLIKKAGNTKIVSYMPNNAYIVSLDQEAEDSLNKLTVPAGPIQWIGVYDPYYKMDPMLPKASSLTVDVRIGIVNGPQADQTLQAIERYALEGISKPNSSGNQIVVRVKVGTADLSSLTQLSDVLWIEPVAQLERRDEVQDLIMADRISSLPGHSPVPGVDDYLDFLTNVVGFSTSPVEYPILDVADTLATATIFFNDFFELGSPVNPTRLVGFGSLCTPGDTLCDNFHGPFVMSVAAAYNDSKADPVNLDASGFRKGLGVNPFGRISNLIIFHLNGTICEGCLPNGDHGFGDIPLNEYLGFGARISNNSWGDAPLVIGGNSGVYNNECQIFDGTVRDAVQSGSALVTNTTISIVGSNVVTNTVITVVSTPGPFARNQEMITLFAGGNSQGLGSGNGGFGDIIMTPPATAKNVITVGASENVRGSDVNQCVNFPSEADNSFDISVFSSFGPTLDGRFKPEIVAPGAAIFGVDGFAAGTFFTLVGTNLVPTTGNAYICESGTSFSTPAASATAQLLWWFFEHRLQNEQAQNLLQPSPAMTKAYMCNSARYLPLTNPQTGAMDTLPSIAQGMGSVDLARMFDGVPRIIRDESTPRAIDAPLLTTNPVPQQTYFSRSGQSYEVKGLVADPTNPFRVTLAWTDAPGTPGAFKQLVNDLDLQVTIGGQIYKGNVFAGADSVPAAGSFDRLNNIESVFLPAGQTGTWSVIVRAANIAANAVPNVGQGVGQDFALVVYNAASTNRSDVPNLSTNDSCQTALEIDTFPFTFTNGLNKAVYHNTHPSPSAGPGGVEEFFKLAKATPGSTFTIDTFGSTFDTVLSVWQVNNNPQAIFVRGECGALVELASNNDSGGSLQSSLSFTADGSNDYYIVVEPHNDGNGGTLVLNVNASASLVTLTPTSLSFGDQVQGTTSAVQTVTYANGYSIPVSVGSVAITGTDASDFEIISQTCEGNIVPSVGNCLISIVFLPQDVGARQANLVFNDDATGSPRVVPLSGTGTPPAPLVCLGASGPLVFTNTAVGVTSAARTLIVTNCGTAPLHISSATLSGTGAGDFSVTPACTATTSVPPGVTCNLSITFTPTAAGTRQATLTIASDISDSPTTILLQGTGFIPAPALCPSLGSVNFGGVGVGITSAVQTLTITNCGTAPLVISNNITITGISTGEFFIVSTNCATVATNSFCQIGLRFAPTNGGPRSATLSIADNIAGSPQLVTLTGTGDLSQPDAAIGKNTKLKKMVGFGTNDTTGAGQELVQKVSRGARKGRRYFVAVKNIGSGYDRFLVQSQCVGSCAGFTVNYFIGAKPSESVDVTAAVGAATFGTGTMGPGAVTGDATMIRVEVFAAKTVSKGVTGAFTLTFSSASDPTKQDTVRITAIAK